MQDGLVTEAAQAGVAMDDLDLLSDYDVAKDREKGEDSWHGGLSVDDQKRDMVDLQAVGQVAHSGPTLVRVRDDNDFVSSINQLG